MSTEIEVAEKKDLMVALKNSLYPGASDEACELVLAFCRAAGMNPILKPVHLVPIWNSKQQKNVDTIMPGIGMYRINAERSSAYAGLSKPIFGPAITEEFPEEIYEKEWNGKKTQHKRKAMKVTYPEWCEITVSKIVGDRIFEFHAQEFWKENYATASRESNQPNEMWTNRPYGQIAKCAEAQALRKAFPDRVSSQATAEEMEGKFASFTGPVVESEPAYEPPRAKTSPVTAKADPQKVKAEKTTPPVEHLLPDQLVVVKAKWKAVSDTLSEKTRLEGAAYLKKKFGFSTFEEVRQDQMVDLVMAMSDIREPEADATND